MVGRKRLPWRFSKKCLAAAVSTGFSVSTSSLMLSEKGARSFFTSLNGSRSVDGTEENEGGRSVIQYLT